MILISITISFIYLDYRVSKHKNNTESSSYRAKEISREEFLYRLEEANKEKLTHKWEINPELTT